jgi:glycosyltransferase involved in cell wall biosynthesis
MKVSVVIPVHNKAPWLKASIGSVLAQSYRDFELIAVDDLSTDDSLQVLRGIDDARLRVVALERNLGPAGAAQRAMDLAAGEYIVRMDADDEMMPDRIMRQVAFMDANPAIGASGSHQLVMGSTDVMRASLTDAECRAGVLFQIPMFQPTSIYRRQVLVQQGIRFSDDWPRYGEDWWLQARLLRVTQVANIDAPLLSYRVGEQNVRARGNRTQQLSVLHRGLFEFHGWPLSDEQLRAHLHSVKWFPEPLLPADVRAVRRHLDRLARLNAEHRTFPGHAFDERLHRVWDELGYRLPPFGLKAMAAYLAAGGGDARKLRYMAASWLKGRP